MGRREKYQLTANEFRAAFIHVLSKRTHGVSPNLDDKGLILIFENLSPEQRVNFWEDVKAALKCPSDWPVKHYSNVFLAAKYSVRLQQIPDAKKIIAEIVDAHFAKGQTDQKAIKNECYKAFSEYDVFPIQIDNQIYHLVKEARKRFAGRSDETIALQDKVFQQLTRQAETETVEYYYNNGLEEVEGLQTRGYATQLESMTCGKVPPLIARAAAPVVEQSIELQYIAPEVLDFSESFRAQEILPQIEGDKSTLGIQILQSIVASENVSRNSGIDDMPSLTHFFSELAPIAEEDRPFSQQGADVQAINKASSQVRETEEQCECISEIQRKSESLIQLANESFEGCRYETVFEKHSQEYEQ